MFDKNAILTVGISASGKTTWATSYGTKNNYGIISRDDIRRDIQIKRNIPVGNSGVNWQEWHWKDENLVTDIFWEKINNNLGNIIIADTNLNTKFREILVSKLIGLGYAVSYKTFPLELEEACKRDSLRENSVGKNVISKQYAQYYQYIRDSASKSNKQHIICDIDGTIAIKSPYRSFYDWDKVYLDSPCEPLRTLLTDISENYDILYVSGRDEICLGMTETWLKTHKFPTGKLFMRPNGDNRKDAIVKMEIYENYIKDKYTILCSFDDKPSSVMVWKTLGIFTFVVDNES